MESFVEQADWYESLNIADEKLSRRSAFQGLVVLDEDGSLGFGEDLDGCDANN